MTKKKKKKAPTPAEKQVDNQTQDEEIVASDDFVEFLDDNKGDNSFTFDGKLTDAIFPTVTLPPILTTQETDQILKSKKTIEGVIKDYEKWTGYREKICKAIEERRAKDPDVVIDFNIQFVSGKKFSSIVDINNHLQKLREIALEHLDFLRGIFKTLLGNYQYHHAANEMKAVIDYSQKLFEQHDLFILTAKLDYNIALLTSDFEQMKTIRQEIIDELKALIDIFNTLDTNEAKKANAIANIKLAQIYVHNIQYLAAEAYLNESERLRKEYNAPETDMDKIRFMRGQIAYHLGDNEKAVEFLMACYEFRQQKDNLNSHLIPVLELLIDIKERNGTPDDPTFYINHLLNIQINSRLDERKIIATQLRLLTILQFHVSGEEYWKVMGQIEDNLNRIPVTGEDIQFLKCFVNFVSVRMKTVLPQDWSNVKKRAYYSDTLKIMAKAGLHANAMTHPIEKQQMSELLAQQREEIVIFMETFDDPGAHLLKGEALHPEDQAALAEQKNIDLNENNTANELFHLSEFSSEIRHSKIAPEDSILTVEEFESLPTDGLINPYRLRAAQGGYNTEEFRDERSLDTMLQALIEDPIYTQQVDPIEIGIHEGKVYSFDTRRLITHQRARESNPSVVIRYQKISGEYLEGRIKHIFSPRPWNGLVTAARFEGKNGYSEPYINPGVREQLDTKVASSFKYDPSQRKDGDDDNGFPSKKKSAQKIFDFLKQKKEEGSEFAKGILKEMDAIFKKDGKEKAFDFLIEQKSNIETNLQQMNTPLPEPEQRSPRARNDS